MAETSSDTHARVLSALKAHGWNSTSFQILEPGVRYWFDRVDGCIAYVDTGRAWVVAGAPVTARIRFPEVTAPFLEAAGAARRRVCAEHVSSRSTMRDARGV